MKLRNKKTGEINLGDLHLDDFNSLAELNDEWEDYEEPRAYWYINDAGVMQVDQILSSKINMRKSIGNYFETEQEVEKAVEELMAWKRLKDKGFRFTGWYTSGDATNTIRLYAEFPDVELGPIEGRDLSLLFGGEE